MFAENVIDCNVIGRHWNPGWQKTCGALRAAKSRPTNGPHLQILQGLRQPNDKSSAIGSDLMSGQTASQSFGQKVLDSGVTRM